MVCQVAIVTQVMEDIPVSIWSSLVETEKNDTVQKNGCKKSWNWYLFSPLSFINTTLVNPIQQSISQQFETF